MRQWQMNCLSALALLQGFTINAAEMTLAPDQLPDISSQPLSYVERLAERDLTTIDMVVIHCTESENLDQAREFGEKIFYAGSQTGNSGHYYIDRDGSISLWVPLQRIAHHVRGYNPRSIGIELVNLGRYPHWFQLDHQTMQEAYPTAQIEALQRLLISLTNHLPNLKWIAGHEDLDRQQIPAVDSPETLINRKRDPGEHFPWEQIMRDSVLERYVAE